MFRPTLLSSQVTRLKLLSSVQDNAYNSNCTSGVCNTWSYCAVLSAISGQQCSSLLLISHNSTFGPCSIILLFINTVHYKCVYQVSCYSQIQSSETGAIHFIFLGSCISSLPVTNEMVLQWLCCVNDLYPQFTITVLYIK